MYVPVHVCTVGTKISVVFSYYGRSTVWLVFKKRFHVAVLYVSILYDVLTHYPLDSILYKAVQNVFIVKCFEWGIWSRNVYIGHD